MNAPTESQTGVRAAPRRSIDGEHWIEDIEFERRVDQLMAVTTPYEAFSGLAPKEGEAVFASLAGTLEQAAAIARRARVSSSEDEADMALLVLTAAATLDNMVEGHCKARAEEFLAGARLVRWAGRAPC